MDCMREKKGKCQATLDKALNYSGWDRWRRRGGRGAPAWTKDNRRLAYAIAWRGWGSHLISCVEKGGGRVEGRTHQIRRSSSVEGPCDTGVMSPIKSTDATDCSSTCRSRRGFKGRSLFAIPSSFSFHPGAALHNELHAGNRTKLTS